MERLHADYTGIRPKLYREGEPVPDFAIHGADRHGQEGLVALYGIESPGLTASLAIGEVVAGHARAKARLDDGGLEPAFVVSLYVRYDHRSAAPRSCRGTS